ncbi:retinol dehydrogenase 12-like [Drosophila albomicans]|uniref:NADP-retinol dehydrogenase n=1 Tax=Drosophila albomicans TaxID=7291 RepID=A0A6P8WRM8_DROAB|nr:retinol dehydrogenase 12-like [Drosophila albomicans]
MPNIADGLLSPLVAGPALIGLAIYLIRDYMQGGQFKKKTDETGKIVIVTGSNTGIGKETVLELARRGATVYMACRDEARAEKARQEIIKETKNENVFYRELDLASLDSIRKFAENFKKEQSKLHILINNAGIFRGPRRLTKDGFEMQIGVNHMGHFLLTSLLLDLLKKAAPSRIVNVSSLAHTMHKLNVDDLNCEKSYDETHAYCQSKLANVMFTRELAKRLEGTGVTVTALHPGLVDTEIFRNSAILQSAIVQFVFKPLLWPFIKTPKSGAQTTLYAALDPSLEGITGEYFSDCRPKPVADVATDEKASRFLWQQSEKWTGAPKIPQH